MSKQLNMTEAEALKWASELVGWRHFRTMTITDLRTLTSKLNRALKAAERARKGAN